MHCLGRQWRRSQDISLEDSPNPMNSSVTSKSPIRSPHYEPTLFRRSPSGEMEVPPCSSGHSKEEKLYRNIIRQFSETESDPKMAPFSIHNLVQLSTGLGRTAGNWFGPSTAAFLLQMAWLNHTQAPGNQVGQLGTRFRLVRDALIQEESWELVLTSYSCSTTGRQLGTDFN